MSKNGISPIEISPIVFTPPDRLVQEFASRGIVILSPESLGVSSDVHDRVYTREKEAYHANERVTPGSVPAVLDVINSPGLVAACNQLVGENWAIVPFTHNASFTSGARDQHWHKDDNGPYNSRKQRHHQAVQIEMIYYPQTVTEQMGPTATIPYAHYWTYNHEENHDNFAGADHLDFDYMLSGMERTPVSGPDSPYAVEDILNGSTEHDARMRDAVTKSGWPLVKQMIAAPMPAGTIILYSHNTFHRGHHRRDDWNRWKDHPRFMWRFYIYRTTDTITNPKSFATIDWDNLGIDPMTKVDLSAASDSVTTVWRYHDYWMRTGQAPPPRAESAAASADLRAKEADRLFQKMHTMGDEAEPTRIGAAYKLASIGDNALAVKQLGKALYTDRESVRRAATYGLVAVGPDATPVLLKAAKSPIKWVRKAGVYGLGDASLLTDEVLQTVAAALAHDSSVYVRSVAAGTLGCLGRRAVALGKGVDLIPACMDALLPSLLHEKNRLAMSKAQGRSIKFVRPTDECDVCEGDGVDFGFDRFDPVRSTVRENVLWSMVILCSHGADKLGSALEPTIAAMKELIRTEKNVICVGYAMDVLTRLAKMESEDAPPAIRELQDDLLSILAESPVQCWESLIQSGLGAGHVSEFAK